MYREIERIVVSEVYHTRRKTWVCSGHHRDSRMGSSTDLGSCRPSCQAVRVRDEGHCESGRWTLQPMSLSSFEFNVTRESLYSTTRIHTSLHEVPGIDKNGTRDRGNALDGGASRTSRGEIVRHKPNYKTRTARDAYNEFAWSVGVLDLQSTDVVLEEQRDTTKVGVRADPGYLAVDELLRWYAGRHTFIGLEIVEGKRWRGTLGSA